MAEGFLSNPLMRDMKGGGVEHKLDDMMSDIGIQLDVLEEDIMKKFNDNVQVVIDNKQELERNISELSDKMEKSFDDILSMLGFNNQGTTLTDADVDKIVKGLNLEETMLPLLWNYFDKKFEEMPEKFTDRAFKQIEIQEALDEKKEEKKEGGKKPGETSGSKEGNGTYLGLPNGRDEQTGPKRASASAEAKNGTTTANADAKTEKESSLRKWMTKWSERQDRGSEKKTKQKDKNDSSLIGNILTIALILAMLSKSGMLDALWDGMKKAYDKIIPDDFKKQIESITNWITGDGLKAVVDTLDSIWSYLKETLPKIVNYFKDSMDYVDLDDKSKQLELAQSRNDEVAEYFVSTSGEIDTQDVTQLGALRELEEKSGYISRHKQTLIEKGSGLFDIGAEELANAIGDNEKLLDFAVKSGLDAEATADLLFNAGKKVPPIAFHNFLQNFFKGKIFINLPNDYKEQVEAAYGKLLTGETKYESKTASNSSTQSNSSSTQGSSVQVVNAIDDANNAGLAEQMSKKIFNKNSSGQTTVNSGMEDAYNYYNEIKGDKKITDAELTKLAEKTNTNVSNNGGAVILTINNNNYQISGTFDNTNR